MHGIQVRNDFQYSDNSNEVQIDNKKKKKNCRKRLDNTNKIIKPEVNHNFKRLSLRITHIPSKHFAD